MRAATSSGSTGSATVSGPSALVTRKQPVERAGQGERVGAEEALGRRVEVELSLDEVRAARGQRADLAAPVASSGDRRPGVGRRAQAAQARHRGGAGLRAHLGQLRRCQSQSRIGSGRPCTRSPVPST